MYVSITKVNKISRVGIKKTHIFAHHERQKVSSTCQSPKKQLTSKVDILHGDLGLRKPPICGMGPNY